MRSALVILLALAAVPQASAWWMDADHTFGDGGLTKTSVTTFFKPSQNWVTGLNAGYYNNDISYPDKVWSFKLPVMRSFKAGLLTLKPFFYPESGDHDSSAWGGKAGFMMPLGEDGEDGYRHLTFSAAGAKQRTTPVGAAGKEDLSSYALEAQLEQSFFDQFFLLAHAAGFVSKGVSNSRNAFPVMDASDLAFLGSFAPVTQAPEWTAGVQFARNMAPDYDSHVYAGFSRISVKAARQASSGIFGMRLKLWETSSIDLGYNLYKRDGSGSQNRYKILYQVFF